MGTVPQWPAGSASGITRRWIPATDLVETGEHFILKADLPGMTESEFGLGGAEPRTNDSDSK